MNPGSCGVSSAYMTHRLPGTGHKEGLVGALAEAFSSLSLSNLGGGAAARLPRSVWEEVLLAPLSEYLLRPGKALRAELLKLCFEVARTTQSPDPDASDILSVVVEALQAGSLIIDDIEDESELRRGGLSLHRILGVSRALNAGNWLFFWPFELLERLPLSDRQRLDAYRMMTRVLHECHYGQALDLGLRLDRLEVSLLGPVVLACSELKTGSLVGLSAGLGALLAGAETEVVEAFSEYGRGVGVALQMLDDLSSLVSTDKAHKAKEDLTLARVTWPFAWVAALTTPEEWDGVLQALRLVQNGAPPESLIRRLLGHLRDQGRLAIDSQLHGALDELASRVPDPTVHEPLRRYQEVLLNSYRIEPEVS